MGYVFDFKDASAYDRWAEKTGNQQTLDLENRLMLEMLRPICGDRLIDIGCGTGSSLTPFLGRGISLTGVDPSAYMLDIAEKKFGGRVELRRAKAEDLPFDDNSFEYATLCLSLEFSDDPEKALAEACRVSKHGVFVGILNKYSIKAVQRRVKGVFVHTIYNQARFFGIQEIRLMFFRLLGDVPVEWRTTAHIPGLGKPWMAGLEPWGWMRKNPFGAFAGIMAVPAPRFRTQPLELKSPGGAAATPGRPISCVEKKRDGAFVEEPASRLNH